MISALLRKLKSSHPNLCDNHVSDLCERKKFGLSRHYGWSFRQFCSRKCKLEFEARYRFETASTAPFERRDGWQLSWLRSDKSASTTGVTD
jgi:hypothetical protein